MPEVFYCYSGKHAIQDAVILSCCCQIIGCRTHVQDLIDEHEFVCPLCKASVSPANIKPLPSLSRSIQRFIEQSETLIKPDAPEAEKKTEPAPTPAPAREESRSSTRRDRSRSHDRSHRSRYGGGMPSGTPSGMPSGTPIGTLFCPRFM